MFVTIKFTGVRHHRYNDDVLVWEGDWYEVHAYGYDQRNEHRRVRAYIKDGMIFAAVTLRPDYDPCGKTDWNIYEEWSAE